VRAGKWTEERETSGENTTFTCVRQPRVDQRFLDIKNKLKNSYNSNSNNGNNQYSDKVNVF